MRGRPPTRRRSSKGVYGQRYFTPGVEINDISVSSNNIVVVSTSDNVVHVFQLTNNGFEDTLGDSSFIPQLTVNQLDNEILITRFIDKNYQYIGNWGFNGLSSKVYNKNQAVTYNNELYVCLRNHTSTLTDTFQPNISVDTWKAIDWKSNSTYSKKDKVLYNGRLYTSRKNNNVNNLPLSSLEWRLEEIDFGFSVAITRDGSSIAIGIPNYSELETYQGSVAIFTLSNGVYFSTDLITSSSVQESEQFGSRVKYDNSGNQLVIFGQGGYQTLFQ